MIIFPCSRCGERPEVKPGIDRTKMVYTARIEHGCRNGRLYKTEVCGPDPETCRADCIYVWNEQNAKDNPAWWPERYDYLRTLCKVGRRDSDA